MSALSEKLKAKKFPHKDVTICLDASLVAERDQAMAELRDAQKMAERGGGDTRLNVNPVTIARKAVDKLNAAILEQSFVLRITAVSFAEYNSHVLANPPRKGIAEPVNAAEFYMYVARRSAQVVVGDDLQDITDEEWAELEANLTDGEHDLIARAVTEVNRRDGVSLDFTSRG